MTSEPDRFGEDAEAGPLPTAGVFRQVWSFFVPDRLVGSVSATARPDGDMEFAPHYEVAGGSVDPSEYEGLAEQRVHGRTVTADASAGEVYRAVGAGRRVRADRARETIRRLAVRGVAVRATETGNPPGVVRVRAAPSLALDDADRLTVTPRVLTKSGRQAPRPRPVAADRGGWYAAAGHLFHAAFTGTEWDRALFAAGPVVLTGDDVPRFLAALPDLKPHLAGLDRDERVRALSVRAAAPRFRLAVAGDGDRVRATPQFALAVGGRIVPSAAGHLDAVRAAGGGYVRDPGGWLSVTAEQVGAFDTAVATLPPVLAAEARDEAIPDLLRAARDAAGNAADGWEVTVAPAVSAAHGLHEGPPELRTTLDLTEADGQPELTVDTTLSVGGRAFAPPEYRAAIDGRRWVRVPAGWAAASPESVRRLDDAARGAGLTENGGGWRGPAEKLDAARESLLQLGEVTDRAAGRLLPAPRAVATTLTARDAGDRPEIVVAQTVDAAGSAVPLEQFGEAVRTGKGWLPVPAGWVRVDERLITDAAAVEGREGVRRVRGELIAAADRVTSLAEAYAGLGEVRNDAGAVKDQPWDFDISMNLVPSDGDALLRLDPEYRSGRFRLSAAEVEEALGNGREWVRLTAAWVKVDAGAVRRVRDAAAGAGLLPAPGGAFNAPPARYAEVAEALGTTVTVRRGEGFERFLNSLTDIDEIEPAPLPDALRPGIKLRPYQKTGHDWLCWLRRHGLAGVLADDMGLGKTLQTLCAVRAGQERRAGGREEPVLIVCLASLLRNWQSEIEKFLAGVRTWVHHGSGRGRLPDRLAGLGPGAVQFVVTSYATGANDIEQLREVAWSAVVLDEAHAIKNPSSKRARALRTLPARSRLCLTGTPLQNRLTELWSLFEFLMPGFLGTRAEFGRTYAGKNGANLSRRPRPAREPRTARRPVHPAQIESRRGEGPAGEADRPAAGRPFAASGSPLRTHAGGRAVSGSADGRGGGRAVQAGHAGDRRVRQTPRRVQSPRPRRRQRPGARPRRRLREVGGPPRPPGRTQGRRPPRPDLLPEHPDARPDRGLLRAVGRLLSTAGRQDAAGEAAGTGRPVQRRPVPRRLPHQHQSGRDRAEPHRGRHGHLLRPRLESRQRPAGRGPRPPHRTDEKRDRL